MSARSVILNSNNWEQFNQNLLELNKKEKGNTFELFTKAYFKAHPVYRFYDEVWLLDEVPANELKKLGIPSQDLGIDLIAKNGKEYHAIQCKYHTDKNKSVSYKEVSTFLTMLGNSSFSQGYICSSANGTSKNLDKVKTKPISYILSDTWSNIDEGLFSDIQNYLEGKSFKPQPFEPRNHQVKAIKEAKEHFKKESRGKLIFPCGAGKSLTGFWFTQELKSKNTIIAVPSLSLIKQTLDVYLREIVANKKKVKWLCICSDDGIGRDDDIVFKTENIGVPCQTDPVYIENWLKENKNENKIIFTTYQSGKIIAELSKKLDMSFDLGIFDEAHKTVGSSKKLFSHLLFEKNISIEKRIFMTATERFYGGQKSEDIISMDDVDIYGDTFSMMTFKEAIEAEPPLLTDYKVITIDIKQSEISEFLKENRNVNFSGNWDKDIKSRSLASMLALRKAMKLFPIKNAVSFHSSIKQARLNEELQDYISDTYNYDPIDTFTVSGKIPTTKRNDIVQEFAKSDKALITNARCLTEGVDVPNIDCIVFADPRRSKVDIVQALGRALRTKKGKDWGYVILPVIYDDKTNEIDNDNFNEILSVVRGLAANDERIVDYFKFKESERIEKSKAGERIFNFEVFSEYIDESELKENLQIKLWDKLSRFEWMPFNEAREYVRTLKINSGPEYIKVWKQGKLPKNIPGNPRGVYKNNGFISIPDFLGYDSFLQEWHNYEEAIKIIHPLNLKSVKSFWNYIKENPIKGIPHSPQNIYKDIWEKNNGWSGFLGKKMTSQERSRFQWSYIKAKEFVWGLKLKTGDEWKHYTNSDNFPVFLPKAPQITYKEWNGIEEWLGPSYLQRNERRKLKYLPFSEARDIVRKQKFKNWEEYKNWKKRPPKIPLKPNNIYGDEFTGRRDWLGLSPYFNHKKQYMDYDTAQNFLKEQGVKSNAKFRVFKKSDMFPKDFPPNPPKYYKNIWKDRGGWGGFCSSGYVSSLNRSYLTFAEARAYARSLNLNTRNSWFIETKKDSFPNNIPVAVHNVYKDQWKGWADFLGKENK